MATEPGTTTARINGCLSSPEDRAKASQFCRDKFCKDRGDAAVVLSRLSEMTSGLEGIKRQEQETPLLLLKCCGS